MTKVIDISSWQDASTPEIDFNAVKASGIVGVMIKFTQGLNYQNPKARSNAAAARAAGLLVGAYHVAQLDKNSPELEAEYFLRSIDGELIDLATALDIESFGTALIPVPQQWAEAWLAAVSDRAPYTLIYLNEYLFGMLNGAPWGYGLWAAQFTPPGSTVSFMEQLPPIDVPGINGAVDISVLTKFRVVNAADAASNTQHAKANRLPALHFGDTGLAVKLLQRLLRSHSHNIAVDGEFGPDTLGALRDYQAHEQLSVDGICGPLTWAALAPNQAAAVAVAETLEARSDTLPEAEASASDQASDAAELQVVGTELATPQS